MTHIRKLVGLALCLALVGCKTIPADPRPQELNTAIEESFGEWASLAVDQGGIGNLDIALVCHFEPIPMTGDAGPSGDVESGGSTVALNYATYQSQLESFTRKELGNYRDRFNVWSGDKLRSFAKIANVDYPDDFYNPILRDHFMEQIQAQGESLDAIMFVKLSALPTTMEVASKPGKAPKTKTALYYTVTHELVDLRGGSGAGAGVGDAEWTQQVSDKLIKAGGMMPAMPF